MVEISVIVPNYNHASFLKKRLESILNQSFQDFELILLDDSSDDNSIEVIDTYKNNPKVSHFIINENNSGSPFKQWARGIELAQGKYIWLAESDDYADINFLENTVAILKENKNIGLVSVKSILINSKGRIIDKSFTRKNKNGYKLTEKLNVIPWQNYIKGCLNSKNAIYNASSVLFRNEKKLFLNDYQNKTQYGDTFFLGKFLFK